MGHACMLSLLGPRTQHDARGMRGAGTSTAAPCQQALHGRLLACAVQAENARLVEHKAHVKSLQAQEATAFVEAQQRALQQADTMEVTRLQQQRERACAQRDAQLGQLEELKARILAERCARGWPVPVLEAVIAGKQRAGCRDHASHWQHCHVSLRSWLSWDPTHTGRAGLSASWTCPQGC
jgi:hypothetical protein